MTRWKLFLPTTDREALGPVRAKQLANAIRFVENDRDRLLGAVEKVIAFVDYYAPKFDNDDFGRSLRQLRERMEAAVGGTCGALEVTGRPCGLPGADGMAVCEYHRGDPPSPIEGERQKENCPRRLMGETLAARAMRHRRPGDEHDG